MARIHGVRSFAALRARSDQVDFAGYPLLIARLESIIQSKRAAGRPRDKAVLGILEETLHEKEEARNQKGTVGGIEGGK